MSRRARGSGQRLDWSLVPISLAVLSVCLYYAIAQAFGTPYIGFSYSSSGQVVIQVDDCQKYEGWCQANPKPLMVGDRVIAIADIGLDQVEQDRSLNPFLGYRAGDTVSILVERDGVQRTILWQLPPVTILDRAYSLVGHAISLPFWLAGSIVLLFLWPRGKAWRLLVAFHYLTALWFSVGVASNSLVAASSLVMHALSWILVPVYLHLHFLVPEPLIKGRIRPWFFGLHACCAILAVLEILQILPNSAYVVGLAIAILGSLGLLLVRLFDRSSLSSRPTARLMLAGVGLALGPGLVVGIAGLFLDFTFMGGALIAVALLAVPVLPLTHTYAIYKRRMGPIEFRAHRLLSTYAFALVYGTAFLVLLIIGVQLVDPYSESTSVSRSLFVIAATLVFVITAPELRSRFQRVVNRMVYGTEHDANDVLYYFVGRIAGAVDRASLARLLTYQLAPSLLIRQWALYPLAEHDPGLFYAHGVADEDLPQSMEEIGSLLSHASRYGSPNTDDIPGAPAWVRLVIVLRTGRDVVGAWLFGDRDPDGYYPQDDINLLETLGSQVAVALKNITLNEQAQREIAERKRIAQSLRLERDTSQRYLDVAGVMILALDTRGEITLLNRRGHEILGYEYGALLGRSWFDVCVPEDVREQVRGVFSDLIAGRGDPDQTHRQRVRTKDGAERIIAWRNTVLRDDDGVAVGTLSSGEDRTEQLSTEAEHRELVAAMEQAGEAILVLDDDGLIRYVNAAFEKLTGFERSEALGKGPLLLDGGERGSGFYRQMWSKLVRGEAWSGRLQGEKKDGATYEAEVSIAPICGSDFGQTRYVIIQRDVTEQVKLELQLRQAQKMEAIGRLAGGVAHDFNNLLTVMQGYTRVLLSDLEQGEEGERMRSDLQQIAAAAERAADLTGQLLAFSRKQLLQLSVLDLNQVIRDTEKMLRRLIGEDIKLITQLDACPSSIKAEMGQIEQVVMNLAINARDAMPGGGCLILCSSNVFLGPDGSAERLGLDPGPYVKIAVRDNGVGMDDEIKSHLFEPFYTTKLQGKGTGLGLATVYGIVKQSGGEIRVESELGQGTQFEVYFPMVEGVEEQQPGRLRQRTRIKSGSETVLLVEDEESVRVLARRVLERKGYAVLDAQDTESAIQLVENHRGRIDLILTDVIMPGEQGVRELAARAAAVRPETRLLYMSGYTDDMIANHGVLEPGLEFIAKPFSPSSLADKVRDILDDGT